LQLINRDFYLPDLTTYGPKRIIFYWDSPYPKGGNDPYLNFYIFEMTSVIFYHKRKGNGMKISRSLLATLIVAMILFSWVEGMAVARIEVSQSTSVTSTTNYYERDPKLLKASDGTWFLIFARSQSIYSPGGNPDNLIYDIHYSTSTDNGDTWTEADVSKRMTLTGANFWPGSIVEADGKIWIIASNLATGDIYCQTTSDFGTTWTTPTLILTATQDIGAFHLDAVVKDNNIFVFFAGWANTDGIYLLKYNAADDTWGTAVQTLTGGYRMPRVIKDGANIRMVTTDWNNIYYHTNANPESDSWTTAVIPGTTAPSGGSSADPTIVKDPDGGLWVAYAPWYATDKQNIVYLFSSNNGASWSSPIPFTTGAYGAKYWWDFRPCLVDNGNDMLFFMASERNYPIVTRGVGDIVYFRLPRSKTGFAHYDIVQAAIDAAANTDSIFIATGEYRTPINIDGRSSLKIFGYNNAETIIKPDSAAPWLIPGYPQYDTRKAAVRVYGSTDIQIYNIGFDFDLVKGNNVAGLLMWNSSGTLGSNRFSNMSVPDASGGYYELTCYFRAEYLVSRQIINVTYNEFSETGRIGVIAHDNIDLRASNNIFGKTVADFGYAIELGSGAIGAINNNSFSGYNTWALTDNSASAAILIENSFTTGQTATKPVTINDNEITACQYGIYLGNSTPGYAGDVDIVATINRNNIHDNATTGGQMSGGILINDEGRNLGSSVTATITNNTIVNNGNHGIVIFTDGNGDITATITDNKIFGNSLGLGVENYGSVSGSLYNLAVYKNMFDNIANAQNNTAIGYWDDNAAAGNCWSDWATNPGYPLYNIPGTAGSVDRYPNVDCGTGCDCKPGDANSNGFFNLLDISYTIKYLYQGGSAPIYKICSGDSNCDCKLNLLDVSYLIRNLYQFGPKPCSCAQWLNRCGFPLRSPK
jgi:hypothetical protein